MFNHGTPTKYSQQYELIKIIISLVASGIILFVAIGFAWFIISKEPDADSLSLKTTAIDCDVVYTLTNEEKFLNAKPGDTIPLELEVKNITKSGILTLTLDGISYEPVEFENETYDIRDAFSIVLTNPIDSVDYNVEKYLHNKQTIDILTDYPVNAGDTVPVRINFKFLETSPYIPDINIFQGEKTLQVSHITANIA